MQPSVCSVCGAVGKQLVAMEGREASFHICTSCYFNYFMEPGIFESREREPAITVPS
jgi:ribosome-binding protein aMBF1 (putative translation factor)